MLCAPLEVVRLSNSESTPKHHGLDVINPGFEARDYLRCLMRTEPVTFAVRYAVGRPDASGLATGEDAPVAFAEASAAGMGFWDGGGGAAAASRRSNPFLKDLEPTYREYDEVIVPQRVAQLVMSTRTQLAAEWAVDLMEVARDDASFVARFKEFAGARETVEGKVFFARRPVGWYEKRVNEAQPIDGGQGDSSPLRGGSLDLVERLATRLCATELMAELPIPLARILEERLRLPQTFATADQSLEAELAEAACRVQVDALGMHRRKRGLAHEWLEELDNDAVSCEILKRRASLLALWACEIVELVRREHTEVLRESLEWQASASSDKF